MDAVLSCWSCVESTTFRDERRGNHPSPPLSPTKRQNDQQRRRRQKILPIRKWATDLVISTLRSQQLIAENNFIAKQESPITDCPTWRWLFSYVLSTVGMIKKWIDRWSDIGAALLDLPNRILFFYYVHVFLWRSVRKYMYTYQVSHKSTCTSV